MIPPRWRNHQRLAVPAAPWCIATTSLFMKLFNSAVVLLSTVVLLLAATEEVRGFVLQHAIPTCGVTSFGRHAATAAPDTCSVSMSASRNEELSRAAWVGRTLGVAFSGVVAVTQGSSQALAELGVGEGGLPNGARQFSNLIKVQKDWIALGKTVKDKRADLTADEWKNVALFLRKVYQLGGDLEYLAGQFPGDKKKVALDLVRGIQVEAADVPAREKNVDAFLAAQGSIEKKFGDYMELFNDVPSEL